jgi:hypothetical protein
MNSHMQSGVTSNRTCHPQGVPRREPITTLSPSERRRICALADCHEQTLLRFLQGRTKRGTAARIEAALEQLARERSTPFVPDASPASRRSP